MTTLNKTAAESMSAYTTHDSTTDVTEFGLLGHALEMTEGSNVGMKLTSRGIFLTNAFAEHVPALTRNQTGL